MKSSFLFAVREGGTHNSVILHKHDFLGPANVVNDAGLPRAVTHRAE
jgi:hypothetical protein